MDYFAAIATPNTMKAPSVPAGPTPSGKDMGDDSRANRYDKTQNKTSFSQHLARQSDSPAAKSPGADHPVSKTTQPLKEKEASASAEDPARKNPTGQTDTPVEGQQPDKGGQKAVTASDNTKKKEAGAKGDQPGAAQNAIQDVTANAAVIPSAGMAQPENTVQAETVSPAASPDTAKNIEAVAATGQKKEAGKTSSSGKDNTAGIPFKSSPAGQGQEAENTQGSNDDNNAVLTKSLSGDELVSNTEPQSPAKSNAPDKSKDAITRLQAIENNFSAQTAAQSKAQDTPKSGKKSDDAAQVAAAGTQPAQQDPKIADRHQQVTSAVPDRNANTETSGLAGQRAINAQTDNGKDNSPHNQAQNQNQANIQLAAQGDQGKIPATAANPSHPFATMLQDGLKKDGGQTSAADPAGNSLSFATLGTTQGSAITAHTAAAHGADRGYMPNGAPLVASQVAVQISKTAGDGKQEFSIRLDPADLGRVDVKLSFHGDGKVTAAISADHQHTLDMLQRDARTLDRALQNAGLQTDNGSLSFSLRQQGQQQQQNFTNSGNRPGWMPDMAALPEDNLPDTTAVWAGQANRALDIRI